MARKNRQTKVNLVFDEEQRKSYLKGFRKRKNERRLKAKEELELRLKEEKKRIREERQNVLMKIYYTERDIPEVAHLVTPKVYELPNHTVTISSLEGVDFQGKEGLLLGSNKIDESSTSEIQATTSVIDETDEAEEKENETAKWSALRDIRHTVKRSCAKQMKTNKVMATTRRLQQKKDRKQFHRQKKAVFRRRAKLRKRFGRK